MIGTLHTLGRTVLITNFLPPNCLKEMVDDMLILITGKLVLEKLNTFQNHEENSFGARASIDLIPNNCRPNRMG